MYCFFNKFFFKVEIFGNLPIFCHAHLVAIQDFVDREILFDRCGKCPMLCLFFDFKWTISAVKSTAHVMPCFMRQHSAFLCGGLAFAAINDKEIVKERDCGIVFEFNIHNNRDADLRLKRWAQKKAMEHYGWPEARFIQEFGRSYL